MDWHDMTPSEFQDKKNCLFSPEIAKVIRQGKHGIQMIRAKELVPGDLVEVSVGDKVSPYAHIRSC